MLRSLTIFLLGVYVGQEYSDTIPNVKTKVYEVLEEFKKTELYKKMSEEIK